jgi:hypothetical protein
VVESRRELLIILTPRIVYGKEDSDLVKQIESSRMSWILGDVIKLHGEAGLRSRCDEWSDADIEAVFPNYVPEEGLLPLSQNGMLMDAGPELTAPYCDPTTMPPLDTAPLPAYEQQPGDEPQIEPAAPLPPQPTQSPPAVPPQAATGAVPDKYGFVDMAAAEEPPASINFAPLRLPESDE